MTGQTMPTSDQIRRSILQTDFLKVGPMRIKPLFDEIAMRLSLTTEQKDAKDLRGNNIFSQLFNEAISSLLSDERLIITDHGFLTPLASRQWQTDYIVSEILQVPIATTKLVNDVDILTVEILRISGYPNPYAARELRKRYLLPIRRIHLRERNLPKIG